MGRGKMHARCCRRNLRERDLLEDLGVDGIMTSKWFFMNRSGGSGMD
jgi:hypothetical protein